MTHNVSFVPSSNRGSYRGKPGAERWNSTVGIPPVKWRPLADKSCTNGAIWRTYHALVAPPGGQVTNYYYANSFSSFLSLFNPMADRSCTSVATYYLFTNCVVYF